MKSLLGLPLDISNFQVKEKIPLRALADADVKELSWFVNRTFIGRGRAEDTLFFEASPGHYDVIVVDDQGRTATRDIQVSVSE